MVHIVATCFFEGYFGRIPPLSKRSELRFFEQHFVAAAKRLACLDRDLPWTCVHCLSLLPSLQASVGVVPSSPVSLNVNEYLGLLHR